MAQLGYINFFSSRKVATSLFLLFFILVILGVQIPQENYASTDEVQSWLLEHPLIAEYVVEFGLTRIYSGVVFITTVLLLCASTIFCSYRRIRTYLENKNANKTLPPFLLENELTFSIQGQTAGQFISCIKDFFFGKKYQVREYQYNTIIVERGKIGFWGSIFFHLSFVVIVVGALVSIWTRFEGVVLLTEGQTFTGKLEEYTKITRYPVLAKPEFDFFINYRKYVPSTQPEIRSSVDELQFIDPLLDFNTVRPVRAFHAISHRGFTFYQQDHGYSPRFIVEDKNGKKLFDALVALRTSKENEQPFFDDFFVVPIIDLKIHAVLYPDAIEQEGEIVPSSSKPLNPIVNITNFREKKMIGKKNIKLGDKAEISDFQVNFDELRYWSSFRVVRDSGIPVLYAGFFVGIIGFIIRMIIVRQKIIITIKDNYPEMIIKIAYSFERDAALYEERIHKLVDELKNLEGVR